MVHNDVCNWLWSIVTKVQIKDNKMAPINFDNKIFSLVQNSDKGQVDSETIFEYKQDGDLVTADYFGGAIKYGKIIAQLEGDKLNMLYQCLTTSNELKAGKATAKITFTDNGKLKLSLDWEWLSNKDEKGHSVYVEIENKSSNKVM